MKTTRVEETHALAAEFAKTLKGGELVALIGDLGSGKTTFVRGVVESFGSTARVKSPTFTVMNEYPIEDDRIKKIVHLDLYRFSDPSHLEGIALDDVLRDDTVVFVEWPNIVGEVFGTVIKKPNYEIQLTFIDETTREIVIS